MKKFLAFLEAHGRFGAALMGLFSYIFLFGGTAFPFFLTVLLTPLPLFLGLWKWGEEGLFIASATALTLFFLSGTSLDVIGYGLFYVCPLVVFGRLFPLDPSAVGNLGGHALSPRALSSAPLLAKNALEVKLGYFITLLGASYTLFFLWFFANPEWVFQTFMGDALRGASHSLTREQILALLGYLPSVWGAGLMGLFAGNLALAHWLIGYWSGDKVWRLEVSRWTIATWQYWVFVLVAVGCFAGDLVPGLSRVACNLLFFAALPFAIEGSLLVVGLLRRFLNIKRGAWIILGGLVFLGWPLLIVVMMGVFEPWNRLRERFGLHREGE